MNKQTFITTILFGLFLAIISLLAEGIYAQEKSGIEGSIRIPDSTNVQILTTKDGATNIGRIIAIGEATPGTSVI